MAHKIAGTLALCALAAALAACTTETVEVAEVSTTPSVQQQACLAAVSNTTNNGDVAVLSDTFSEANTTIMVGVGPDRAPWRCLVSNDGVVADVMSMTNEGAL